MAKKTHSRAVSRKHADAMLDYDKPIEEDTAVLDNPEMFTKYGDDEITANRRVSDLNKSAKDLGISYPASGDDIAKMRGKELSEGRSHDFTNSKPYVEMHDVSTPPDRANDPRRRPGV